MGWEEHGADGCALRPLERGKLPQRVVWCCLFGDLADSGRILCYLSGRRYDNPCEAEERHAYLCPIYYKRDFRLSFIPSV